MWDRQDPWRWESKTKRLVVLPRKAKKDGSASIDVYMNAWFSDILAGEIAPNLLAVI